MEYDREPTTIQKWIRKVVFLALFGLVILAGLMILNTTRKLCGLDTIDLDDIDWG